MTMEARIIKQIEHGNADYLFHALRKGLNPDTKMADGRTMIEVILDSDNQRAINMIQIYKAKHDLMKRRSNSFWSRL